MKGSGINYFFDELGLNIEDFKIFYTFEDGVGQNVSSISSGNNIYTGYLNNINDFWIIPGSGFFSGNNIEILNGSGLNSFNFTHLISYEKNNTGGCVLIDCSNNSTSGYKIGITDSNKIYFETYNNQKIIGANYNNISSKNLISIAYTTNHLEIGYYNFNSKLFEIENFDYNFGNQLSSQYFIGNSFTGYMDYYLYFSKFFSSNTLNSLASGFYNTKTGIGYQITTISTTGITGFQNINYIQTGITGYITLATGFDGVGDFTGLFPTNNMVMNLTGIIQSEIIQSCILVITTLEITGGITDLFYVDTEYIKSFGMEKISIFNYMSGNDLIKNSISYTPLDNNYNIFPNRVFSGYDIDDSLLFEQICPYLNGLAQFNSGWYINSGILYISGNNLSDVLIFDIKYGDKNTGNLIYYSGQQLFLNGINLISGYDFIKNGDSLIITGNNTGIDGILFDYPIILNYITGNNSVIYSGIRFSRNTSILYINGIRQINKNDYIEGSLNDLITTNYYNQNINNLIYNNDNLFWN